VGAEAWFCVGCGADLAGAVKDNAQQKAIKETRIMLFRYRIAAFLYRNNSVIESR
jgi:hypothetical protein